MRILSSLRSTSLCMRLMLVVLIGMSENRVNMSNFVQEEWHGLNNW